MGVDRKAVAVAVAITGTVTVIVVGIVFYVIHRLRSRTRTRKHECSFRREELRPHGAALKGVIVEEEGRNMLYLHGNGRLSGCFTRVWYNPMMEEVKRMNCREEKPGAVSEPEPIQEIPLLIQQPINRYEFEPKKKVPSPPSPPPTPLQAPPPPPPPPLPTKPKPAPPPPPPPKPRPPPLPQKLIPSHKPPMAPRIQENRSTRGEEGSAVKVKMDENRVQTTKLKPLHWDKVVANADHSMVWNEINDGSFRFDDELMESLFGYTGKNKKPANKTAAPSASPQTFILDPRKSQNTAIILRSLAVPRKEILHSLMEGRGLNADTLEKLIKICPTQEETNKIIQFNGNPAKLADAEAFLHQILNSVPWAFLRFNAMLFRENYDQEILHLKESLQVCELGCKELRNGGIFFKLLEAILKAGNRMNAGTNRGNAQGFNLTALPRLSDVKSTDGKTTLLHFVVEQVVRSEGNRCLKASSERERVMFGLQAFESLNNQFTNVKKAAGMDYDSLTTMCSILTARVREIKLLLSRSNVVEPDRFVVEMKGFLEDCEEELNVVREEERRVVDVVKRTTVYYQMGVKGGNPLQLFVVVKDFLNNVDRVCEEIKNKLQKMKTGDPPPPLSPAQRSPVRIQNLQNYLRAQRVGMSSSDSEADF